MQDNIRDKVVIVTGASSGIGRATAAVLAGEGAKLALAARREDRLRQLAAELEANGAEVLCCPTDVTDRAQVERLAAATLERFGRIDVLVNNAGLMPISAIEKGKVDEWERMVDVNVKGVLYAIHAVLGHMLGHGQGHIINVSSIGGHLVFPGFSVYCGTKFAVWAISDGLRQETAGRLRVTTVSPGAVATELVDHITDTGLREALEPAMETAIPPEAICRAIAYAIAQPPDVAVNELIIRPTAQER
jgi:NADP-dependent 3-hydroxy acid dehydrogenase YdfG